MAIEQYQCPCGIDPQQCDFHSECENCGMIEVPLKDGHCEGCICDMCEKTAAECGCSMNDGGVCEDCNKQLWADSWRRVGR